MSQKIEQDDELVSFIVNDFFFRNKDYPTKTKITACFNIAVGLFRLCCVCGEKKDVIKLAELFHKELIKEIKASAG